MTQSRRAFMKLTAVGASTLLSGSATYGRPALLPEPDEQTALEFLDAAREGNLGLVQRLLAGHPTLLLAQDAQGRSAFAIAHLNRHRDIGDHLLGQGYLTDAHEAALVLDWKRFSALTESDASMVNRNHAIGGTAMFAAASGGAGSDIWRIYAANGEPSTVPVGATGPAPLQAALRFLDLATAEMTAATLLANNADPNPSNKTAESPLHIAARRGSSAMVEMLIRKGARVEAKNSQGLTAAALAVEGGHEDAALLLERHDAIPRTHRTSRTAYDVYGKPYRPPSISDIPINLRVRFVGSSHGNLEAVTKGIGVEPRMVHSEATTGERCIEACAHTGRIAVVDFLLEHGAPYSLPTAVMRKDRPRVVELLDEDPLRIQERGAHDFALLWYPVIGNCGVEMMELLLERGAEVEQQHFLGTTALHWACLRGAIDIARLLLERGANIHRRARKFNAAGETPLQCAQRTEQTKIAQLLKQHGATA